MSESSLRAGVPTVARQGTSLAGQGLGTGGVRDQGDRVAVRRGWGIRESGQEDLSLMGEAEVEGARRGAGQSGKGSRSWKEEQVFG